MTDRSSSESSQSPTTAPSSPPDIGLVDGADVDPIFDAEGVGRLQEEEERARTQNEKEESRRQKVLATKRKKTREESIEERNRKAKQLESLLAKSAAFSDILTKKTQVLGRVGSGFDGKALGEHGLEMAKQPKCMTGGEMRDYQLEGLTWMYEICAQGMSGILADEMGLGKTIQAISLIALLRETYNYLGPHLIIAPLSTLSNWTQEFHKWTPSVPVILYHGSPREREELRRTRMTKYLHNGKPTEKFPVVCTSYEIILRDRIHLAKINWEFIIIDEGHRMKNSNSKLFRELVTFRSASRLLITGTPLQNNLKELWSLLHFLLPEVFTDWEAFESWFDFSDLQDEEGTEEFITDQRKQELIKKIHIVLQPLLLRRIKADVEHMLPKKREYILYAPMTKEQSELYNIISDKDADTRSYLERKVVERLTSLSNTLATSREANQKTSKAKRSKALDLGSEQLGIPQAGLKSNPKPTGTGTKPSAPINAFERLMCSKQASSVKPNGASLKRKSNESLTTSNKSTKHSRQSTPTAACDTRKKGKRKSYVDADTSEEDKLSDEDFERRLAAGIAKADLEDESEIDEEARERAEILELARKEILAKKLGNQLMQLRLVCNSPHNFYKSWSEDRAVDEDIVTSSGKMLMLDRLLAALFERGHKVLIFSQFKTQLDIIEYYACDLRGWNVCRIDGAVKQDDRRQQIQDFNEDPDYRLFLLSTRAGGQGINLAGADTVILFDSDWNPQQDLQAIDRAHRIGQTRPVIVYRLATKGTVEDSLLLGAEAKRRLEKLVIKKGGFRTMGQKMDAKEDIGEEDLRELLVKEGEIFQYTTKEELLSDTDLDILCDRSDEAYSQAERGLGNAKTFTIVESHVQV